MTQADPTANSNSARWRATWPRSEANDWPEMRSTPVKHPLSFTSSPLSQPPISAANQNGERVSCQDHSENLGLYKPAPTDPRQDLTATQPRANNSGFGLSSPAPKQPYTKPFSGLPSRHKVTSPYREAGGTFGGRLGIVYPLLPHATRPDTKLVIDAAVLLEAAALGRQSRPPTVLDLEETREKANQPPSQSRRQPHKRRPNCSTGVYRPSKRSPPGRWRVTRPRSEANDWPEMRSTPVKHPLSFTSSPLSQPPISATNQNGERVSCQDHSENLGLYKPAPTDPRQDLTATKPRANNSGFGLSFSAPKQPYTKPFSGLPSRHKVTNPYREAGGTFGGRLGIVYPLLPCSTRPDTKLVIDAAALLESAALGQQSRPPTVLDLEETREKENQLPSQSRRQPHKRRRNRSTGVYRPSKRLPPRGR